MPRFSLHTVFRPMMFALLLGGIVASFARASSARASPEEACLAAFEVARSTSRRVPRREKSARLLDAIAEACPLLPEALRAGAKRSAALPESARTSELAKAANVFLGRECRSTDPERPAAALGRRCPTPEFDFTPSLLEDLSEGHYAFVVAAAREMAKTHTLTHAGRSLLLEFVLASSGAKR